MKEDISDNSLHWFVGYVKSCQERSAAKTLEHFGVASYIPIQKVKRQWSDRVKLVDRLVIPGIVFVRCTFADRLRMLESVRAIYAYITDGPHNPAVVSDAEMEAFARMVADSSLEVNTCPADLAKGDRVKVISGPLLGLECELVRVMDKSCLAVRLNGVGTVVMEISLDAVKKIDK